MSTRVAPMLPPPPASPARPLLLAALDLLRQEPDRTLSQALAGASLRRDDGAETVHLAIKELTARRDRFGRFVFRLCDGGPELVDLLADHLGVSDTVPAPPPARDTVECGPPAEMAVTCGDESEAA